MNNTINYSGFVEMFMNSSDDYEPYGCESLQLSSGEALRACSDNSMLYRENLLREFTDD